MGVSHILSVAVLLLTGLASIHSACAQEQSEEERAARWTDLRHALFGDRQVDDGSSFMSIDAPVRALDAALVPVSVTLKGDKVVKGIYFVIDDNPAPMAGHFVFGPDGDPHSLKMRVRVNAYTYMHAIAETQDGNLYMMRRFIKAAGGCSAPAGADEQQALLDIGHIRLRLLDPYIAGKTLRVQLMIKHPNFNGMQMDQLTRMFTPARFINTIDVNYGDVNVVHVDSNISLAADPVITFGFVPKRQGELRVEVHDTKNAVFNDKFDVPAPIG